MKRKKKLVKISAVAQAFGVSPDTIRSWIKRGVIKAIQIKPGLHRRFDLSEIEKIKKEFNI